MLHNLLKQSTPTPAPKTMQYEVNQSFQRFRNFCMSSEGIAAAGTYQYLADKYFGGPRKTKVVPGSLFG
jgi:hypothetical protein